MRPRWHAASVTTQGCCLGRENTLYVCASRPFSPHGHLYLTYTMIAHNQAGAKCQRMPRWKNGAWGCWSFAMVLTLFEPGRNGGASERTYMRKVPETRQRKSRRGGCRSWSRRPRCHQECTRCCFHSWPTSRWPPSFRCCGMLAIRLRVAQTWPWRRTTVRRSTRSETHLIAARKKIAPIMSERARRDERVWSGCGGV